MIGSEGGDKAPYVTVQIWEAGGKNSGDVGVPIGASRP